MDVAEFMGFVTGVLMFMEETRIIFPGDRVNIGQISSIVIKFLNDTPARWNEPACNLVVDALMKAFPCKK